MKVHLHYGKIRTKLANFEEQKKIFSIFKMHLLSRKAHLHFGKHGAKLVGFEEQNSYFYFWNALAF